MNMKNRIKTQLNIVETYIREEDQGIYTVSTKMALQAIKMLKEDFEELYDMAYPQEDGQ